MGVSWDTCDCDAATAASKEQKKEGKAAAREEAAKADVKELKKQLDRIQKSLDELARFIGLPSAEPSGIMGRFADLVRTQLGPRPVPPKNLREHVEGFRRHVEQLDARVKKIQLDVDAVRTKFVGDTGGTIPIPTPDTVKALRLKIEDFTRANEKHKATLEKIQRNSDVAADREMAGKLIGTLAAEWTKLNQLARDLTNLTDQALKTEDEGITKTRKANQDEYDAFLKITRFRR